MELDLRDIAGLSLNHFSVDPTKSDQRINFPDFLIVGPQRTGTTWIYENLRSHSELLFSFPKELYFFNRVVGKTCSQSLHKENFQLSVAMRSPRYAVKELTKIAYFDYLRSPFLKPDDLRWYSSFFKDDYFRKLIQLVIANGRKDARQALMGEATASYATLPQSMIQDIVALNPNIKIVLMVRDPVQRAWSHAKKDLVRDALNKGQKVTDEMFKEFFRSDYQVQCGSYSKMVGNWKACLPEGALFVGNYSNISENPALLVSAILTHLGVRSSLPDHVTARLSQHVNPTSGASIPSNLKEYLDDLFSSELSWIDSFIGNEH